MSSTSWVCAQVWHALGKDWAMGNFRGGATAATKNAELGFLEALLVIL